MDGLQLLLIIPALIAFQLSVSAYSKYAQQRAWRNLSDWQFKVLPPITYSGASVDLARSAIKLAVKRFEITGDYIDRWTASLIFSSSSKFEITLEVRQIYKATSVGFIWLRLVLDEKTPGLTTVTAEWAAQTSSGYDPFIQINKFIQVLAEEIESLLKSER